MTLTTRVTQSDGEAGVLQRSLIKAEGPDCLLARAVGGDWKGNLSP